MQGEGGSCYASRPKGMGESEHVCIGRVKEGRGGRDLPKEGQGVLH